MINSSMTNSSTLEVSVARLGPPLGQIWKSVYLHIGSRLVLGLLLLHGLLLLLGSYLINNTALGDIAVSTQNESRDFFLKFKRLTKFLKKIVKDGRNNRTDRRMLHCHFQNATHQSEMSNYNFETRLTNQIASFVHHANAEEKYAL